MNDKKIAVIILGYNSQKYLNNLLDSLVKQDYKNVNYYYIDNDSNDNSIKIVERFEFVQIIKNKKNYGYAGAYTRILDDIFQRDYDAVVLLNPDVIVDKDWLINLVDTAYKSEKIGATQSKILLLDSNFKKTQEVGSYGGELHYLGMGILSSDRSIMDDGNEVSFVSGTSLLVKKEAYLKSGGLDRDYFLYSEDLDLCWRMQLCGYKCVVAEQSIIWHHYIFYRIGDSRQKFYYLERNRLFTLWKNYSYKSLFLLFPAIILFDIGIIVHSMKNKYFFEKIKANYNFLKNIFVSHNKHKTIQGDRIISDSVMFKKMSTQIKFEELNGVGLNMANKFFVVYYNIVKHLI